MKTGRLLGLGVAEHHGIVGRPTRQLAAKLCEFGAISEREILDRFFGQTRQHLDGDETRGRRAGNLHAHHPDDFWTENIVPVNASLPRKGAGDRRVARPRGVDNFDKVLPALKQMIGLVDDHRRVFAIDDAKRSSPGQVSAARRLRHQPRENIQQRGLAGSASADVTPRIGLWVATALWIQHIAVKRTVADKPSSRMTT